MYVRTIHLLFAGSRCVAIAGVSHSSAHLVFSLLRLRSFVTMSSRGSSSRDRYSAGSSASSTGSRRHHQDRDRVSSRGVGAPLPQQQAMQRMSGEYDSIERARTGNVDPRQMQHPPPPPPPPPPPLPRHQLTQERRGRRQQNLHWNRS